MDGVLLGLGLESVGRKRVSGEQIERQLTPAPPADLGKQLIAELCEMGGKTERRIVDRVTQSPSQRGGRRPPARVAPGQNLLARHRAQPRTTSAARARAPPSLPGSPTPAPAQCRPPPPLPP